MDPALAYVIGASICILIAYSIAWIGHKIYTRDKEIVGYRYKWGVYNTTKEIPIYRKKQNGGIAEHNNSLEILEHNKRLRDDPNYQCKICGKFGMECEGHDDESARSITTSASSTGGHMITVKYAAPCVRCSRMMRQGETAHWQKGVGIWHENCR